MIQLKIFAIIALCLVPQLYALLDESKLVHDDEYINSINSQNLPWIAGKSSRFEGYTFADVKKNVKNSYYYRPLY